MGSAPNANELIQRVKFSIKNVVVQSMMEKSGTNFKKLRRKEKIIIFKHRLSLFNSDLKWFEL